MKDTMIQQVMVGPGKMRFDEVDTPELKPGEVLLKMKRIGICGSDIHVFHGQHPYVEYPLTQGHEVSAQVVKVSEYVEGFKVGQKVTIEPQIYCGKCYSCRNGKYNICENLKVMGFQDVGAASDYFAIDASKVTHLPDNITYDEGALIEPLSVAVHAVNQAGDVKDKKVVVLGDRKSVV